MSRSLGCSSSVSRVLRAAARLAEAVPGVVAVGLAGSWARNTARRDSDVDLVVLSNAPETLLERDEWHAVFDPAAELIAERDFGAMQERRLRLPDGTVVEVGIGLPDWARINPVDPGTRRVVVDGFIVLSDSTGVLDRLVRAVRSGSDDPTTGPLPHHAADGAG